MIRILFICLGFAWLCKAQQSIDQPEEFIPTNIILQDEFGASHSIREFSAHPFLILPIFASCHTSCPLIVEKLISNLTVSGYPIENFRVLVFSFDSNDTDEILRNFRKSNRIPPMWMIAKATPRMTAALMQSIGVRTINDARSGQYSHADLVSVVGPSLWNSKNILRKEMTPEKMTQELKAANKHSTGLSKDTLTYLLPLGILGSLFCVFLFSHVLVNKPKSQDRAHQA
jgi:cytochrome oxidase Cu insertion factor (SCO1/SenC/PrrC family)